MELRESRHEIKLKDSQLHENKIEMEAMREEFVSKLDDSKRKLNDMREIKNLLLLQWLQRKSEEASTFNFFAFLNEFCHFFTDFTNFAHCANC